MLHMGQELVVPQLKLQHYLAINHYEVQPRVVT